ncbi:MAG TPA: GNAT family N-acetyltransferase [Haliangium sp.]|nr:GNAT family N-acetyltransferase [Haliangium sp.]
MSIRPVSAEDRRGLEAVLRSDTTFRVDEIAVALELVDAAIGRTDDYRVLVAAHAGVPGLVDDVAGYLCYGPTPMTAATYDLYWIVIHRAARGRGLAGALLAEMERELAQRQATAVRVETSEQESHGAARRLYARHGYPEVARLDDFYGPGDALVLYYKRL